MSACMPSFSSEARQRMAHTGICRRSRRIEGELEVEEGRLTEKWGKLMEERASGGLELCLGILYAIIVS